MEKIARQIASDKIRELNERVDNVDNQVFRYLMADGNVSHLLIGLITDVIGFDDVELFDHYMDVLKEFKEEHQETIKAIKVLELEISIITTVSLLNNLDKLNDDINYLVDRLKDIKIGMFKKEYIK